MVSAKERVLGSTHISAIIYCKMGLFYIFNYDYPYIG